MTMNDVVYTGIRLYAKESYGGMSRQGTVLRKKGHMTQCITKCKKSMDKFHGNMLKHGIHLYIFAQCGNINAALATTLKLRAVEGKFIMIWKHNQNTQQQPMRGVSSVKLID